MSPKCIKSLLSCVLLLLSLTVNAQFKSFRNEESFIWHLTHERLYIEKLFLLQQLSDPLNTTRINLEKGWTFHTLSQHDSAVYYYQQSPYDSIMHYGFDHDFEALLFRMDKLDQLEGLYAGRDTLEAPMRVSLNLMNLRYTPAEAENNIPDYLLNPYNKYYSFSKKSAVLAGTFSALLPGAGKLYLGRKTEGLNMLLANAVMGLQAYESYRLRGPLSPRFIIFGGAFTTFYVANIWGAVSSAKKIKKEHRKQLHHEISSYYLRDFSKYPY